MDVQARLARALLDRAGEGAHLVRARSRPWASATFTGLRHVLTLAMRAERAEAFADGLEESAFDLPRHFVADIALAGRSGTGGTVLLEIEALTIEEH